MKKAKRVKRDENILRAFIKVYCRQNHSVEKGLCSECSDLLEYALRRNEKCPLDPKPRCKKCHVHCYKPEMRERIRKVMAFSGKYYLKRGRLDWVYKYIL